ncbi:MAG: response regulator [Coleofasciculus sp. S288]|nr:response regulator [Coleofasciculus sp. S288]
MIRTDRENLGLGTALLGITLTLIVLWPGVLKNLLAENGFIPHGHCYLWKPGLVWLHAASDSLIALAYVAISATLAYLVQKTRQEIPFHWMFLAFGSFIVACGSTHFMDVWTLWRPNYWLAGGLKLITAVASVTTAFALPPLVPKALTLVQEAKLSEERRLHLETANQELKMLYGKLKELDHLKTQFFANVSHELRTPLALILGPTEKLLTQGGLNEEQHHDLEVIDRNARLLLKQVNDLLDVSKLEAGKMDINYAEVDLAQLIRLTAANFDGLAQERQITFDVETPESVSAQVDAQKVQRVLLNLLSNAFKFTPQGGSIHCVLSIHVNSTDQSSDAAPSEEDYRVERAAIAIQDSGPGVPPQLRETIFDRFSQGEGGATRRFGGTGLGLAIVKEFVELHGGTIRVSDAPSGGASFTVELPLVAPPDVTVSKTGGDKSDTEVIALPLLEELRLSTQMVGTTQEQETGKPLVLVIEDNPEMNQFITGTLATEYCTATAFNGQEGLELAIALHPDLILSDVMMPQMSGDQFVHQLRTHSQLDTTPIILLTAKADDELRVQLLREGAQDYLMKPFSLEELRARVGNLIAIKRVRDLLQQELTSQSQDLEALVQEVTLRRRELQIALEAIQRQAKELEEANRLKDEFLAIISHELRTPLNAILLGAQLLRSRKPNESTMARTLETIERNAKLQIQLIENLLDISRLLRGKLLLDKQSVALKPLIEAAINTVQAAADAKAIQLESVLDASVGSVSGDRDRLKQIVESLLTNAIKFTPQGGRVDIRLECQDENARIQVSDTGTGISAEFLPHVFDYFRQADSSTTRTYGGLGLGLAIVRQLVQLHDGTIEVDSPGVGQGATFTVTLPMTVTPNLTRYLN